MKPTLESKPWPHRTAPRSAAQIIRSVSATHGFGTLCTSCGPHSFSEVQLARMIAVYSASSPIEPTKLSSSDLYETLRGSTCEFGTESGPLPVWEAIKVGVLFGIFMASVVVLVMAFSASSGAAAP